MAVRGGICLVSTNRQMMDKHGVAHHWNDSALKRKEVLTPAATRMNPEDTVLSERSHTKPDKRCVTPLTGGASKRQIQIQKVEGWLRG